MVALSRADSIAVVLKGSRDPHPVPFGANLFVTTHQLGIVFATFQLFVKLEVSSTLALPDPNI